MDLLEYLSQQIAKAPNSYKRRYRKDMVKALINSYPEGTPIRGKEFNKALQYGPNSSGGTTMSHRLLKRGEISRKLINNPNNVKNRLYAYKVLVPGNTYDKERQDLALKKEGYANPAMVHAQRLRRAKEVDMLKSEPEETDSPEEVQTFLDKHLPDQKTYTFDELEALAMKHQFYCPGDTIAGFINSLKGEW